MFEFYSKLLFGWSVYHNNGVVSCLSAIKILQYSCYGLLSYLVNCVVAICVDSNCFVLDSFL